MVFFNHKYEQRPWICKDRSVRSKAKQGNGDEPRIDQYRVRLEISPLAKASHWGNLRRQGIESFEMRVGRPTGIDRIFAKNGYGDVLPVFR